MNITPTQWRRLREAAWDRAGGHCEITGVPLGERGSDSYAVHHRLAKGMGGTSAADVNVLSNLLALSHSIHNGVRHSVHLDPAAAYAHGWLLRRHQAPRLEPALIRGVRMWLTDDGRYVRAGVPARQRYP